MYERFDDNDDIIPSGRAAAIVDDASRGAAARDINSEIIMVAPIQLLLENELCAYVDQCLR